MDNAKKPAFPVTVDLSNASLSQVAAKMLGNHGLTKRELFAMAAMQGMLSACLGISGHENDVTNLAQVAVKYADALLKELNNNNNEPIN